MKQTSIGLADVVAGTSAISTVEDIGSGLHYRGYAIEDLAAKASFEEVAYLLLYKKLPTIAELNAYQTKLMSLRKIPQTLKTLLELIPKETHPMDVLRTACSMLGTLEPEITFNQQQEIADRLLAICPGILCYWYTFHNTGHGVDESDESSISGHFLCMLQGKAADKIYKDMLNTSLILYAEHDFNASTFAARVTASTLSDFYSAITSAIGTLRGPLHGGANEAVMYLLEEIAHPEDAERVLLAKLAKKEKIMGFGHRVYRTCDPRSAIIEDYSKRLADYVNDQRFYASSKLIELTMKREKNLFPNLDFYSASAYHFAKIPTLLFTPIFVMARIAGWSAHIMEQREDNRLMRPLSIYTGPAPVEYVELALRG